eukprot:Plantae.Rhodophyta-Purpureofilum_apyrenoidigerum.ctg48475.p1 GENE.Plantae.Rhodophyta-Purpureofilum_apyrenoidigerum.ctg48475~~Plantae.Rhodophyta-Purpureofilum_apyrenoidigerum.ctg48475.p1  ORF type:complete len:242 (+),score=34.24 Plantae.Rhodophyta-Purpureofilum_apyrenoidigerum.ctg48475:60-785(+)
MDLSYVFLHSAAEVLLLLGCVFGFSVLQNRVIDHVVRWIVPGDMSVPWVVPTAERHNWNAVSFTLWLFLNVAASFILHLPSLWPRRVQLRRPLEPLDKVWYAGLKKPCWHPSELFFPMAWIPAKVLKSLVNSIVWETVGRRIYMLPVIVSVTCIVVADLWNQVFFVQHDKFGAVCVFWLLVILELVYLKLTRIYAPSTSSLLYPLLSALLFASTLTSSIWVMNRDPKKLQAPNGKPAAAQK